MRTRPTFDSHIDWLTCTLTEQVTPFNIIPPVSGVDILKKTDAPPRFDLAFSVYPAGRVSLQKTGWKTAMLELRGEDLQAWREAGIDSQTLINACSEMRVTTTRLDYCINVRGAGKVAHLRGQYARNLAQGRAKPYASFKSHHDAGDTFYIGSTKSEKFLRCYNKAAQMEMLHEAWLRVEMVARKRKATPLLHDMAKNGVSVIGKKAIREMADFPNLQWYQQAVNGDDIELTKTPRKMPDFLSWLNKQVGPAIASRIERNEHKREIVEWLEGLHLLATEIREG